DRDKPHSDHLIRCGERGQTGGWQFKLSSGFFVGSWSIGLHQRTLSKWSGVARKSPIRITASFDGTGVSGVPNFARNCWPQPSKTKRFCFALKIKWEA